MKHAIRTYDEIDADIERMHERWGRGPWADFPDDVQRRFSELFEESEKAMFREMLDDDDEEDHSDLYNAIARSR